VYGPESSGKTTVALHAVAGLQKLGGVAAFIDAEHALDPSWARRIGVNIDDLLVSQPDCGEQALEICELLVRSGAVDLIVVDSVAALIPRAEIDGEMGDSHVGLQARLMSQAMRKLTGAIAKGSCTVIFINQIREKIGVMFGSPETTPGGRALKFYASVCLDVRRTEFDIMYDEGISGSGDLLDLAVNENIVDKSGAWFSYGETRLGQGRENSKRMLRETPELFEEIRRAVLRAKGVPVADDPRPQPAGEASATDDNDGDSEADARTEASGAKGRKTAKA